MQLRRKSQFTGKNLLAGLLIAFVLPVTSHVNARESTFFTRDFNELATLPSFSMGAPVGLVPSFGVVFAGIGGLDKSPGSGETDGSMAFGMGYGDPHEKLGGAITVGVGSVTQDDDFGSTGVLSLSVGRFFPKQLVGLSLGVINIEAWSDDRVMPDPSYYAAISLLLPEDELQTVFNLGIGNNGYAPLRSAEENRKRKLGGFVSMGVYVFPQLSIVVDYTSGVTSAGISLVPFVSVPLTINMGAYDVYKYIPGNEDVSFIGSIAYAYSFR